MTSATLLAILALASGAGAAAQGPPVIRAAHAHATELTVPGTQARAAVRLRVCGTQGPLRVAVREFQISYVPSGGSSRRLRFPRRQTRRCQWHRVSWNVDFGSYHLELRVRDSNGRVSRAFKVFVNAQRCALRHQSCPVP